MKHYVVISADCHAGPNSPVYRDYLDPQYLDDFDEELAERQRIIDDRRAGAAGQNFIGDDEFKEEWFGEDEDGNSLHEIGLRGGWDAATRDKELDNDAVAGEVVFPGPDAATGTMGAPFGAGFNPVATMGPDHLLAGARAYNRWAAELCQDSPERRAGLIVAPILDDLDGAIAEIRRAHGEGLTGGIIIPPRWGDHESYTSYRYDPVWAVCEELQLPVHCHSGPAAHEDYGEVSGWMSVYGYETIFFTARPLWFMLLTGVFERFPTLKMAVTEAGSYWAADLLWRVDMMATREHGMRKMVNTRGTLTMLPSEYFDRNVKIGVVEHAPARARPSLRDRRRQHHVGQRLPPPRGHVAVHPRVPEGPLLGHPDRRDRADPRAQPGRVLRLRPRQAPAHRRPDRPHPRRPRPDRRVGVRQVGAV